MSRRHDKQEDSRGYKLDFTSALYLNLHHSSDSLHPWSRLTTGVPATLRTSGKARQLATKLARLQGMEEGTLFSSTLHLFWDLFDQLGQLGGKIFVDREAYPIGRWGIERAAYKGTSIHYFSHHDVVDLRQKLLRYANGRPPILLTDGWCPQCGKAAPLKQYLHAIAAQNGLLVLDDTQALGILGYQAQGCNAYGQAGGGLIPNLAIRSKRILVGSSIAKGFGVPVAVLAGKRELIHRIRYHSKTKMHCSPPSSAIVNAGLHALEINRRYGGQLRYRLAQNVRFFRLGLDKIGIKTRGQLFPVQTICNLDQSLTLRLHRRLTRAGVNCLLLRQHHHRQAALSFLINAGHLEEELRYVLHLIKLGISRSPRTSSV